MKYLTPASIAGACGGRYKGPEELKTREVTAVTTDSREITEGCLYVPLKGARVDGHDFIPQAMDGGALVTLTEHSEGAAQYPHILVESTAKALEEIAGYYRRQMGLPVVGVTGSVGKTSTKEMIASVLSQKYRVLKTLGNFNSNVGLPLTIFRITEEDEVAVLEMGISHFGEMTELAETAEPDIMVITNIGECHLEFLGDRDGVLKAKTECLDYVKLDGTVILNGEDDKLIQVTDIHGRRPIFYGMNPAFRVYAENVKSLGLKGTACTINADEESFDVTVPLPGEHMVMNALAGAAVGFLYGLNAEEIKTGIESLKSLPGRSNIIETGSLTLIDDCYNANPMSMKASLSVLNDTPGRRVAILGDMAELGPTEKELHGEVGTYASGLSIDRYLTVGNLSREVDAKLLANRPGASVRHFDTVDGLLETLLDEIKDGDTILVKASHSMQFDRIVDALKEKKQTIT